MAVSTYETLVLPADAYDPHTYVDDEFGRCLGCGHDQYAPCHPDPPATVRP